MVSELASRTTDRLVLKLTLHNFQSQPPYKLANTILRRKEIRDSPQSQAVGSTHSQEMVKEIYQDGKGDLKEITKNSLRNLKLMNF
jgi:hypothetical protein